MGAVSPGCPGIPNTICIRFRVLLAGREGWPAAMFMLGGPTVAGGGDARAWPAKVRLLLDVHELIIDRNAPANANLDLTKLDDIVLFIKHETRTVH